MPKYNWRQHRRNRIHMSHENMKHYIIGDIHSGAGITLNSAMTSLDTSLTINAGDVMIDNGTTQTNVVSELEAMRERQEESDRRIAELTAQLISMQTEMSEQQTRQAAMDVAQAAAAMVMPQIEDEIWHREYLAQAQEWN